MTTTTEAWIRMTIMQGEARASTDERVLMSTVLGSCVSTCLFDPVARVGGMNHFLLAEPLECSGQTQFDGSYGLFLMELLINEMLKLGADKRRMKARVYGGANISAGLGPIGSSNAAFARRFLADERIEKVFEDLEGTHARRVEFFPASGRVRARHVAEAPPPVLTTRKPQGARKANLGLSNYSRLHKEQEMQAPSSDFSSARPQISVLTVDDSASMRALLRSALTANGFAVEQAEDGQEALEWLGLNEVDVVITDINMPRLDGFGLIEQLRKSALHADRPILVLTTESSDEKKARARNAGATGWIVKPFDAEKLTAALRRVTP